MPTVTSFIEFVNGHQRPINRWLGHEFWREFCWSKMSYPLKRKWERFQENFIVKCSLKNSWTSTCKSIKSSSMDLHYNILLLKRGFLFHSSYSMRLIKGPRVSWVVRISEHKGWVVLVWFRLCKGFYKDSANLKWVAWVLDVGTKFAEPVQNCVLHSLFPYLIYFVYCFYSVSLIWIII